MAHSTFGGVEGIVTVTDAWFRQYKNLSDALTAAGFPKTADTGQVDWTTVTAPGTNTYTAYEIRRFDDADQSLHPIFLRIDYAYGQQTQFYPRVQIRVGTGSDGAGNLTGPIGSTLNVTLSGTTTDRDWLFGADESGFAIIAGPTSVIARMFLGIERARNADGDTVPELLMIYWGNATNTFTSPSYDAPGLRVYDLVNGTTVTSDGIPVAYWRDLSTTGDTLAIGMYYPFGVIQMPTRLGTIRNKLMIGVAYFDFSDESVLDVPRFTTADIYSYRLELKESSGSGGAFGIGPSGSSTTASDSPVAFAMPAIFWD